MRYKNWLTGDFFLIFHYLVNNAVKFGGWYKLCIWEKMIIPEIKNANIVITELYNRIYLIGQTY